ncbi:MAG: DUF952 domain-containing protein [Actinomycetota bacterium]
MTDAPLLHIAPRRDWEAVTDRPDGRYRDPSLDSEGFIHLSTVEQVLIPANERFAGRTDLVLLVIDPGRVPSPVVFEDCYETGIAFPHLYDALPVAAVTAVLAFPPQADGTFALPPALTP